MLIDYTTVRLTVSDHAVNRYIEGVDTSSTFEQARDNLIYLVMTCGDSQYQDEHSGEWSYNVVTDDDKFVIALRRASNDRNHYVIVTIKRNETMEPKKLRQYLKDKEDSRKAAETRGRLFDSGYTLDGKPLRKRHRIKRGIKRMTG